MKLKLIKSITVVFALLASHAHLSAKESSISSPVRHKVEKIEGLDIFYREAGDPSKPALVLLHGFPTSSQMYRKVLNGLKDNYYQIAPDYPGFGESSVPSPEKFEYTFDNIAEIIDGLLEKKKVKKYALMIQDYGAPVGFRIAVKHPERVTGLVVMNGNAYEEGFGEKAWEPIFQYWKGKTPELEKTISAQVFSHEGMRWQYTHGTRNPENINPDNWNLDYFKISREGQARIQLNLFYDYQNNITHYPAWQKFLKEHQPPTLLVWGKGDAFFPESGAEGYKRDLKNIDYNILNTGHFPLEEEGDFILFKMKNFMSKISTDK